MYTLFIQIIKDLRDRVNVLSLESPYHNYDMEFYGTTNRGRDPGLSSIKKEEEEKMRATIQSLEGTVRDLRAALDSKVEILQRMTEKSGQLEGELSVLRNIATGASSDQRQQIQVLMQKDEIIRSLEQKLAEVTKAYEILKAMSTADKDRLLSESFRERSNLELQLKQLSEVKTNELSVRELRIKNLEEEMEAMKAHYEMQLVKRVVKKGKGAPPKYLVMAPTVERLYKAAVEVKYEQDPNILAENQKLAHELHIALVKTAD